MEPLFSQPSIVTVYNLCRFSLILARRDCHFCNTRMKLIFRRQHSYLESNKHKNDVREIYEWRCTLCFATRKLEQNSAMIGTPIEQFDWTLRLEQAWGGCKSMFKCQRNSGYKFVSYTQYRTYNKVIRAVKSHWIETRVKPFLKYTDCVDIDETKIGEAFYRYTGEEFTWVWGIRERKSRIPLLYWIKDRKKHRLYDLIKKHCTPGYAVFTDQAICYTHNSVSKLAYFGYYHFWINHSETYVNQQFRFVTTQGIEQFWGRLKRDAVGIGLCKDQDNLQIILNAYCFD